jgi:hypothetical protein
MSIQFNTKWTNMKTLCLMMRKSHISKGNLANKGEEVKFVFSSEHNQELTS